MVKSLMCRKLKMNLKSIICVGVISSLWSFGVFADINPDGDCDELLNSFAHATANYTLCTINHARPIHVCESCIDSYLEVLQTYNQIMKLDVEDDKPCRQELINLDRLQVVEKGYNFVLDLWHKASCSECFKKDDNGFTIANQTDTTLHLKYYFELTEACILNNLNSSSNVTSQVCDLCKEDYSTLNTYYNQHKVVCMDIVDRINITRYKWSTTLRCCLDRMKFDMPFIVSTGALCLLPLLFYIILYFSSKNAEFNIVLEQNRWRSESTSINS
uniref:Osteopetrosis-associated transmembrane protein 1 n=1 Tax=Cacopsylla melanoneura TaxID=428564 RepID=A0A8D8XE17_9HEMI